MSETQAAVATKPVLTKEEKIARINEQIAKLQARLDDIINDRVPQAKVKAPAYVPEVGARVLATVGRKTATTNPTVEPGVVIAVKFPEAGAKGGVQVRVRIKEGTFEEQLVTLYAAQVVPADAPEAAPSEDAAAE